MGGFSHKFSIAPSGETTARIENSFGAAKMERTSSITMPSMVRIVGRAPAVDEKVWCFFFCLFFYATLSNRAHKCDVIVGVALAAGRKQAVITETQWSSVIFKTILVPLHRGRFLVVQLYSSFSMEPLDFSLGANLYQKLLFLALLAAIRPHYYSHSGESWSDCGDLGGHPRRQIL